MRLDAALGRDAWLTPWLPLVLSRVAAAPVLELGCGSGKDTAILVGAGLRVVAIDISSAWLAKARSVAPEAEFVCQDVRAPFPASIAGFGAVVASLSLHYFNWPDTVALVQRIHASLGQGGLLLCRLNSTRDHNFGASGYPAISEGYFLVDGEPKRFFNREDVASLFAEGWRTLYCRERTINRYVLPKAVWELVVEKDA